MRQNYECIGTEGNLKYMLQGWEVRRYESAKEHRELEFDPEDDEKEAPDSHRLSLKQVSRLSCKEREPK